MAKARFKAGVKKGSPPATESRLSTLEVRPKRKTATTSKKASQRNKKQKSEKSKGHSKAKSTPRTRYVTTADFLRPAVVSSISTVVVPGHNAAIDLSFLNDKGKKLRLSFCLIYFEELIQRFVCFQVDVICGTGVFSRVFTGNCAYLEMIEQQAKIMAKKGLYDDSAEVHRAAESIVEVVRQKGGRFLKRQPSDDPGLQEPNPGQWTDIGSISAIARTTRQLRLALKKWEPEPQYLTPTPKKESPSKVESQSGQGGSELKVGLDQGKPESKNETTQGKSKPDDVAPQGTKSRKSKTNKHEPTLAEQAQLDLLPTPRREQVRKLWQLNPWDVKEAARIISIPEFYGSPLDQYQHPSERKEPVALKDEFAAQFSSPSVAPPSPRSFSPVGGIETRKITNGPLLDASASVTASPPSIQQHPGAFYLWKEQQLVPENSSSISYTGPWLGKDQGNMPNQDLYSMLCPNTVLSHNTNIDFQSLLPHYNIHPAAPQLSNTPPETSTDSTPPLNGDEYAYGKEQALPSVLNSDEWTCQDK